MTELLIAIVPIAVAIVPIMRWPTLERRVRTHLALLKDAPDNVEASSLRSLAARELALIAERDEARLADSDRVRRFQFVGRATLFLLGLVSLFPLVLIPEFQNWYSGLTPDLRYMVTLYGLVLVCGLQWFASGYFLRYGAKLAQKRTREAS